MHMSVRYFNMIGAVGFEWHCVRPIVGYPCAALVLVRLEHFSTLQVQYCSYETDTGRVWDVRSLRVCRRREGCCRVRIDRQLRVARQSFR